MAFDMAIARRLVDEKPSQGQHLYIDEAHEPRDKHIENLFRDLFDGGPIDSIFRTNFEVYYQELIADRDATVPPRIFIDADSAVKWISANIGRVKLSTLTEKQRLALNADDTEFNRVRHVARITSHYARSIKPAYAPSALHAALLAAVFVYRTVAAKRLHAFFEPARRG